MRYIVRNAIFCVTCVHYDAVRQTRYIAMRYMQYFALQRNLATPLQAREKQTSVRRYYPDSRSSGFLSALNVHAYISENTEHPCRLTIVRQRVDANPPNAGATTCLSAAQRARKQLGAPSLLRVESTVCFQRKRGLPSSRLTKAGQVCMVVYWELVVFCARDDLLERSTARAVTHLHQ